MKNPGKALVVLLAAVLLAAVTAGCGKNVDKSDTVRWINGTQALRAEVNGWDCAVFGGEAVKDDAAASRKERLAEEWEVTDRASADETVDWLLSEGHRMSFAERMDLLTESGLAGAAEGERTDFIYEHYELTEEEAQRYAQLYKAYEEGLQPRHIGIGGWLCGRVLYEGRGIGQVFRNCRRDAGHLWFLGCFRGQLSAGV